MPTISGLPAGQTVAGANLFAGVQAGITNRVSADQIKAYVESDLNDGIVTAIGSDAPRTLADWMEDVADINVLRAPDDGVTSAQAELEAAVSAALLSGAQIFAPAGTYLSTATIPGFHSVRWLGPGIVKRGSTLFYVQPKAGQSNGLYVATTGTVGADGLSSSQPMASLQEAFNALPNYGPVLNGLWTVNLAAGTYSFTTEQRHTTPSLKRVTIKGPTTTHPNVPTAILDGTLGTGHGIACAGPDVQAQVQDIKFQNYTSANNRGGLLFDNFCDGYSKNVHASNCDWFGIYGSFQTINRIEGGIIDGCRIGVALNNAEVILGYNASSLADGTIIRNCTFHGATVSRNSVGHIDYCTFDGNYRAIHLGDGAARAHVLGCDVKNNTIGLELNGAGSQFYDNANNWNDGTADANTTRWIFRAYTQTTDILQTSTSEITVGLDTATHALTGTTTPTIISTPWTIPAYYFEDTTKKLRVVVHGVMNSVTALSAIALLLGATTATSLVVIGTPTAGVGFRAEFEVFGSAPDVVRTFANLLQSSASSRVGTTGSAPDTSTALTVNVQVTLADAGDTLTVYRVECFLTG